MAENMKYLSMLGGLGGSDESTGTKEPAGKAKQKKNTAEPGLGFMMHMNNLQEMKAAAGGGEGDGNGTGDVESSGFKLKDITPNFLLKKFGKFESNAKAPVVYETPNAGDVVSSYLGTVLGQDDPQWNDMLEGTMSAKLKARDFLNRKAFMNTEDADRFGMKDAFVDKGNNNMEFNPDNPYGKKMLSSINNDAQSISDYLMAHTQTNQDEDVTNTDESGATGLELLSHNRTHPVMGHYDLQPQGEGQDEKGYYNLYGGKDKWDVGLHDDEKIIDPSQSVSKNLVNMSRFLTDQLSDPQTMNYQTKVYLPGIKKQPRKKIVSPGLMMNADD